MCLNAYTYLLRIYVLFELFALASASHHSSKLQFFLVRTITSAQTQMMNTYDESFYLIIFY